MKILFKIIVKPTLKIAILYLVFQMKMIFEFWLEEVVEIKVTFLCDVDITFLWIKTARRSQLANMFSTKDPTNDLIRSLKPTRNSAYGN